MLEEIKKKIQKRADDSRKEIVVAIYQKMIIRHNDFCGCDYCLILSNYVRLKKSLCISNRLLNDPEYCFDDKYYDHYLERIKSNKNKIRILKQEKDKLKKIC